MIQGASIDSGTVAMSGSRLAYVAIRSDCENAHQKITRQSTWLRFQVYQVNRSVVCSSPREQLSLFYKGFIMLILALLVLLITRQQTISTRLVAQPFRAITVFKLFILDVLFRQLCTVFCRSYSS